MMADLARHARSVEAVLGRDHLNPTVIAAIEAVPRSAFVAECDQALAFGDHPIAIGHGQTISQPFVVAFMTDVLGVERHHKVLEIGTGSGYQAAVLSLIVRRVYTVERHRALMRSAERRLNQLGFHNVVTRPGDGYRGWPELAPFDRIMVTAAAEEVPPALVDQLVMDGIMVIPVGPRDGDQTLLRIVRTETGFTEDDMGPVQFVPLLEGAGEYT